MAASGYFVQRQNYVNLSDVAYDLITDMLANGFTQLYPTTAFSKPSTFAAFVIVLQSSTKVDPLAATQPIIVRIECATKNVMKMDVSTPTQLNSDGTLQYVDTDESTKATLWDRSARDTATDPAAWPMSYIYTYTPRGFTFVVWENNYVVSTGLQTFALMSVQRLVDKTTGAVNQSGNTPVFALTWRPGNTGQYFEYFVVREADVLSPTKRKTAETDSDDSQHVINGRDQVSVSEDGKYILDFPCRFNTPRYCYTDEFDMVAVTSANVVSAGSSIPTTVYGESTPRQYLGTTSNAKNGNGMRLMLLQSGGGISTS